MKYTNCLPIFQLVFLISLCLSQENPTDGTIQDIDDKTTLNNDGTGEEGSGNNEIVDATTSDSVEIDAVETIELIKPNKEEAVNNDNSIEANSSEGLNFDSTSEQNVGTKDIYKDVGNAIDIPIKPTLVPVNLIPSPSDSSSSSSSSSDDKLELELELNNSGDGGDALVDAAAVITTLTSPNTNTKKIVLPIPFLGLPFSNIGPFAQNPPLINPSQFLEPLQQKLTHLSDYLTHPNLGFPRPSAIWQKLQQSGSHLFGGGNGGIFGLGQIGGQDYPFPYRNLERTGKLLNRRQKMDGFEGEEVKTRQEFAIPLEQAYRLHYVLNGKEIEEFVKNVTGMMASGNN